MRCKCCDAMLSDYDMRRKNSQGKPEDFCVKCRTASDYPDVLDWKWRQMEDLCSESNVTNRVDTKDYD